MTIGDNLLEMLDLTFCEKISVSPAELAHSVLSVTIVWKLYVKIFFEFGPLKFIFVDTFSLLKRNRNKQIYVLLWERKTELE